MSHPPVFVSEPNLTPSDKKLGLALRKVFFETTETKETKETTAKQSVKMLSAVSVVSVVSVVSALSLIAKFTFHFSVQKRGRELCKSSPLCLLLHKLVGGIIFVWYNAIQYGIFDDLLNLANSRAGR